jgi:hypothetical protein
MANGRDWTESGPLELPKKTREGWTRFINPVGWFIFIVVGAWVSFYPSKDLKEPNSATKLDASVDAGRKD